MHATWKCLKLVILNSPISELILQLQISVFASCCVLCLGVQLCSTHATPWTIARQAPLFMWILQARILEWVAMPSSRGSSQPRDQTQISCIAGRFFIVLATREAQEYCSQCLLKTQPLYQKNSGDNASLILDFFLISHSKLPLAGEWMKKRKKEFLKI